MLDSYETESSYVSLRFCIEGRWMTVCFHSSISKDRLDNLSDEELSTSIPDTVYGTLKFIYEMLTACSRHV